MRKKLDNRGFDIRTLGEELFLKDDCIKQYVLIRDFQTKEFRMLVCDRKTGKERIYTDKKMICKIFEKCIMGE